MTQIGGMELRWMIRRDLPQVLHIESESFRRPWSEEEFLRQLRQRTVIGMVATDGSDQVYGFMIYELARQELHLLNLAVAVPYRIFDVHVPQLIDEGLVTPRAIASRLLADGVVPSASKHLRYAITRELRSRGIEVACVRPRPWDYAAVRRSAWTHDYDPAYDGPRETLPRDVARFIQRIPEAEDDDPAVESEQLSAETVDDPPAAVDAEAAVDDPSPEDPATRLPVEGEPPAEESAAGPSSDPDRLPAWLVERLSLAWDLVEVAGDVATAARAISAVAALCDLES